MLNKGGRLWVDAVNIVIRVSSCSAQLSDNQEISNSATFLVSPSVATIHGTNDGTYSSANFHSNFPVDLK